jgi:outer membrane lipoprotein-sorting protein
VIGTTVFDMASDGETFRVSIPSKNKFIVGPVAVERTSSKPIENLRPQHLLDALLWPEIRKEESVTLREFNDENARYYILTVLRGGYQVEVLREIWFDRTNLQVARIQTFAPKGLLLSDIRLANWQPLDKAAGPSVPAAPSNGAASFPRAIRIERPHDDYKLDLQATKVSMNEEIPAERFKLEQPAGAALVRVDDATETKQP